jgi:hypothetical protein
MSETKAKPSPRLSKKEARKIVYAKLSVALAEYRPAVKEKKFDGRLKKASKLLAADIAKAVSKQKKPVRKPAKIKAVPGTNATEQATGAVV